MTSLSTVGNDLYTGRRSIDFVGRQKQWYALSALLIALALAGILGRGVNFGIDFRGGSEFRLSGVTSTADYEGRAKAAIDEAAIPGTVTATVIGGTTVRVQTEAAEDKSQAAKTALAAAFGVPVESVSSSLIGPSWGQSVSAKALQALVVFLILVALVMALYFRTWAMAVAGIVALLHDLVVTVGIYALCGFEVTPASMIGFLTILSYSLYDTVVVFDKVRENTAQAMGSRRRSYAQAANLAVNQTLVRSINTTVVALLPILAILVVGFTRLGPGTLLDLSLALFVGIAVGAYSSIFIATPVLVNLRGRDPAITELARQAARVQAAAAAARPTPAERGSTAAAPGADPDVPAADATGRPVHQWAATGPRNQPRRQPRSRR